MQVNTLKVKYPKKRRKTVGRGGKKGTYCGKGNKGQKARSGASVDPLFEGGRSSLVERLKKVRGFKSHKEKNVVVDLRKLEKKFKDGDTISRESLMKAGFVGRIKAKSPVKILGSAELKRKLKIEKGIKLSDSARKAIEKAGGETGSEKKSE